MAGRGRASPRYGTHRTVHSGGYIRIWAPGHPLASKDGYVLEHRLVLYESGIYEPGMHVHHRNGDKTDNRIENLEYKTPRDHHRGHLAERGVIENQHGSFPLRSARACERCGALFVPWKAAGRFCSRVCANRRTA
jgi:hypothetical protein